MNCTDFTFLNGIYFTPNHCELYNPYTVRLVSYGHVIYRFIFSYVNGIVTGWGKLKGALVFIHMKISLGRRKEFLSGEPLLGTQELPIR